MLAVAPEFAPSQRMALTATLSDDDSCLKATVNADTTGENLLFSGALASFSMNAAFFTFSYVFVMYADNWTLDLKIYSNACGFFFFLLYSEQ